MTLPLEIFSQHAAVVGKVGSGKTFMAKGVVERLLDERRRVCIIDPTGAWHGLRSSTDGAAAGYPVVTFGGDHGDVAITEQMGTRLAELIVTRVTASVVDVSEMTMGARRRLLTDFLGELHRLNRSPLHLVIDEADELAPQNPMPETKRLLHETDRIVRRGRIRGFRVMLISQRPAVLHKNVLTQANTLVCMRLTAPQDRAAVVEWVKGQADAGQAKAMLDGLSGLPRGEGWVWSPEAGVFERMLFPAIRTFDSSRSPEEGDAPLPEPKLAHVDLAEIRAALEVLDEKPAETAKARPPAAEALQAEYERGWQEGRERGAREMLSQRQADGHWLIEYANKLREIGERWAAPATEGERVALPVVAPTRPEGALQIGSSAPKAQARPKTAGSAEVRAAGDLHKAGVAVLTVLRQHQRPLTWTEIATLAGISGTSGYFNAGRAQLRARQLISETCDQVGLSDAGRALVDHIEPIPADPATLLRIWVNKISGAGPKQLEALWTMRNRVVSWIALAQACGISPTSGYWNNGRAQLRRNNLIEESPQGIRLVEMLRGSP